MFSRQYFLMLVVMTVHGLAADMAKADEPASEVFREVAQLVTKVVEKNSYRAEKEVLYAEIAKLAGPGARKVPGYFSNKEFREEIRSLGLTEDNLVKLAKLWNNPFRTIFQVVEGKAEKNRAILAYRPSSSCIDMVLFENVGGEAPSYQELEKPAVLTEVQEGFSKKIAERGFRYRPNCLETNDGESFLIRRESGFYVVSVVMRSQSHWVDYPYTFESVQVYKVDGTDLNQIGQITPVWQNVDRLNCPGDICSEAFLETYADLRGNLRKTIVKKDRPATPVVLLKGSSKKKTEALLALAGVMKYREQVNDNVTVYRAIFVFDVNKVVYFAVETAKVERFVSEDPVEILIWDELSCCSLTLSKLSGNDLTTVGHFDVEWSSYIRSLDYHSPYVEIPPNFAVEHKAFDRHAEMTASPVKSFSE
ncbi:hypothetical protein [Emcibacter sp.]|uniref:hypothetical protein n=1 Tax=Emcibacter sp. TaxID=1979954 RepID=UPI003A951F6F